VGEGAKMRVVGLFIGAVMNCCLYHFNRGWTLQHTQCVTQVATLDNQSSHSSDSSSCMLADCRRRTSPRWSHRYSQSMSIAHKLRRLTEQIFY